MPASGSAISTSGTVPRQSSAFSTAGEYAGFWRRFLASFIDATLLFITRIVLGRFFDAIGFDVLTDSFLPNIDFAGIGFIIPAGSVLPIALGVIYFGFFESSIWQATLGKRALGIFVTGMDGERISPARAVGRHLASWISDAVFLAGYLIQPFTPKRQALHDIIASTLVVKR